MGDLTPELLIKQAEHDATARRANGDGARYRLFTAYAEQMKADRTRIAELEAQVSRLEAQLQAEMIAAVGRRRGPKPKDADAQDV